MRYQKTATGVKRSDGADITEDPANRDWREYLEWLEAGNTPDPAEAPPSLKVVSVTRRQARHQLLNMGLLSTVEAALAGMPGIEGEKARIDWETAGTVERGNPTTEMLTGMLGLSEEQIDTMFHEASLL